MKNAAWEKCHYFSKGRCPEQAIIDKAYLIPQLLEPSDIQAASETCQQCEHCHDEKRRYRRVTRPFRVVISNKEPRKGIEGTTVDVSINGALVKLDTWMNFNKDETVKLQLYLNDQVADKEKNKIADIFGIIKRIKSEKQELAIMFKKGTSMKKCANI